MTYYYRSPIGWIEAEGKGAAWTSLKFVARRPVGAALLKKQTPLFRQLQQYFQQKRRTFSVALSPSGTAFQNRVWKALQRVPHGQTVSYAQIAARIGNKKGVRAVASAITQNRLTVIIPCHRVIGSDGTLTGYAYGLRKKAWLLKHEKGL